MKTRLTLQEKLRDLRDERKLKLQDVANATSIPLATMQRIETDENMRAGYQDIDILARFYGVSSDYLFGVTDNRQHRNVEIDDLSLSDSAIEILKSKKLNNRLVSELLSHADFQQLLNSIEIYIDKKLLPHMNTINAAYKLAETTIKDNYTVEDNDEVMALLQNSVIDEDGFLLYRISERFNAIIKSLFDEHRNDDLPPEQAEVISDMKEMSQSYLIEKERAQGRAKVIIFAKQIGLNLSKLTDDEIIILTKSLENSKAFKKGVRKKY